MPGHTCDLCHAPASRLCAGCQATWYCNKRCQTEHWRRGHILDCRPKRPLTSADLLVCAVYNEGLPMDGLTSLNWGFTRLVSTADHQDLLGLYTRVIKDYNVKPRQLEQWRVSGALVEGIREVYEDKDDRYYRWFLSHQDVLASPQQLTLNDSRTLEDLFRACWIYQGKPATASNDEITSYVEQLKSNKPRYECFLFCASILCGSVISPSTNMWIAFGICAASDFSEEQSIYSAYRSLLAKATFDEVSDAYRYRTLLHLFHTKNITLGQSGIREHLFADVLNAPANDPTPVWQLKRLLSPMYNRAPCAMVQYLFGFTNCYDTEDTSTLVGFYSRCFGLGKEMDPLELNEAAVENRLFEYVTRDIGYPFCCTRESEVFARILTRRDD